MLRIYFIVVIAVLVLNSCCYKKDCALNSTPLITVNFKGFTDDELDHRIVYIVDNSTYQVLDSLVYYYGTQPAITLGEGLSNYNLKQQAFILLTPSTRDTISNINYTTVTRTISCNQCFPLGHDKQTNTTYEDFSFTFHGKTFTNTDTINVIK